MPCLLVGSATGAWQRQVVCDMRAPVRQGLRLQLGRWICLLRLLGGDSSTLRSIAVLPHEMYILWLALAVSPPAS